MKTFRHILTALLLAGLLASCSGRPRIIPRGVLTDIYAEMFLADQWLSDHSGERSRADTMLFYDPIFKRYGYTFEDYDASVRRYLKDPEKFSRIFRDASAKLKKHKERYVKQIERLEAIREYNAGIRGYRSRDFDKDTFLWRTAFKDSLLDSLRRLDSLRLDSLRLDSLRLDSLRLDSLRLDSLRRDSLRRDSLRVAKDLKKELRDFKPAKKKGFPQNQSINTNN